MRPRLLIWFAMLALGLHLTGSIAFCAGKFWVTIPAEVLTKHLDGGKRVTAFTVKLLSPVYVSGVANIPYDWWVRVNPLTNPVGEKVQVSAEAGHGASWLTLEEVVAGAFHNFLVIEAELRSDSSTPPDLEAVFAIDIPEEEEAKLVTVKSSDMVFPPIP